MTSICIETTLHLYRNDFTFVSKRLRFVSKRLVSKRLCIETTVNPRYYLLFLYTDDIIKEQRKLKKKTQKLKAQQTQKKLAQKLQGKQQTKGAAANQKLRKRIGGKQNGQSVQQRQGTQGRRRPIAGKQRAQQKQATQGQRRQIGVKSQGRSGRDNQSVKRNTTSTNKGRFGGAKVTANRLKNKLGSLQRVGFLSFFWSCFLPGFHLFLSIDNYSL